MTEGQKSFWISIGAGAVLAVAVAPFAYMFWQHETRERALLKSELAELNSKIGKTNDTLAQLQKTASVDGIAKELGALDAKIKNANDTLAKLQQANPLASVSKELAQLDSKIKGTNDALADIKKTTSLAGVTDALGQLGAKIRNSNDTLAEIQKAAMVTGSTPTPKTAALENAIGDLGKRIEDEKALRGKLSDDIARLQETIKAQATPKAPSAPAAKAEPAADHNDVVVFYVQSPDAMQKAQAAPAIPPMTVRFEKIGSLDDNGQADMIVQKLKAITKGRTDCSVTVAGYADTLGGDKVNLTISKKRAHTVAAKLQTAFAGGPVHVTEAAWGERRLQDWTPNETAHAANRRVDVSVNCKGE